MADNAIVFRNLVAASGWNDAALHTAFLQGLADYVKDELAARDIAPGSATRNAASEGELNPLLAFPD